jgi:hypothetical protein
MTRFTRRLARAVLVGALLSAGSGAARAGEPSAGEDEIRAGLTPQERPEFDQAISFIRKRGPLHSTRRPGDVQEAAKSLADVFCADANSDGRKEALDACQYLEQQADELASTMRHEDSARQRLAEDTARAKQEAIIAAAQIDPDTAAVIAELDKVLPRAPVGWKADETHCQYGPGREAGEAAMQASAMQVCMAAGRSADQCRVGPKFIGPEAVAAENDIRTCNTALACLYVWRNAALHEQACQQLEGRWPNEWEDWQYPGLTIRLGKILSDRLPRLLQSAAECSGRGPVPLRCLWQPIGSQSPDAAQPEPAPGADDSDETGTADVPASAFATSIPVLVHDRYVDVLRRLFTNPRVVARFPGLKQALQTELDAMKKNDQAIAEGCKVPADGVVDNPSVFETRHHCDAMNLPALDALNLGSAYSKAWYAKYPSWRPESGIKRRSFLADLIREKQESKECRLQDPLDAYCNLVALDLQLRDQTERMHQIDRASRTSNPTQRRQLAAQKMDLDQKMKAARDVLRGVGGSPPSVSECRARMPVAVAAKQMACFLDPGLQQEVDKAMRGEQDARRDTKAAAFGGHEYRATDNKGLHLTVNRDGTFTFNVRTWCDGPLVSVSGRWRAFGNLLVLSALRASAYDTTNPAASRALAAAFIPSDPSAHVVGGNPSGFLFELSTKHGLTLLSELSICAPRKGEAFK